MQPTKVLVLGPEGAGRTALEQTLVPPGLRRERLRGAPRRRLRGRRHPDARPARRRAPTGPTSPRGIHARRPSGDDRLRAPAPDRARARRPPAGTMLLTGGESDAGYRVALSVLRALRESARARAVDRPAQRRGGAEWRRCERRQPALRGDRHGLLPGVRHGPVDRFLRGRPRPQAAPSRGSRLGGARGRGPGPLPLRRARHEAPPGRRHGGPARLRHRRRSRPASPRTTSSEGPSRTWAGRRCSSSSTPTGTRSSPSSRSRGLAPGLGTRSAGRRDGRRDRGDEAPPRPRRRSRCWSRPTPGERAPRVGSVSSSSATGPDAADEGHQAAGDPHAQAAPPGPEHGADAADPLERDVRPPQQPHAHDSRPSVDRGRRGPGESGTRKGRAQRLRRIGKVGTRPGGYAAGASYHRPGITRGGRWRRWHDDGGTGRTGA